MGRKYDFDSDDYEYRSNRDAFRDRKEAKEQRHQQKHQRRKLPRNPSYFDEQPFDDEDF